MAHKHNRRRVRRPQSQFNIISDISTNRHLLDQLAIAPPVIASEVFFTPDLSETEPSRTSCHPTLNSTTRRRSDIPAKLWQNRYTAWRERDRMEKEHAAKLEAQQIQLFGGEPGDDVELCYRMLEYFGGLDYIS